MSTTSMAIAQAGQGNPAAGALTSQFLTFSLAGEEYGLDILRVHEIRGWTPVTRVPNTPRYVLGVLNLRGTIVPIIDTRTRFHLEQVEYTPITVIIVVSVRTANGNRVFGIVVDGVSDVLDVTPEEIKPAPDFGTAVNTEFISGLAAVGDKMVMLLDIDKLLRADEISLLADVDKAKN